MDTLTFYLPLGDTVLRETEGSLDFTDSMCAQFAGGPSQTVRGRIWLTETQLAFRPVVGMPHPQIATIQRLQIERISLARRKWLGLVAHGHALLEVVVPYPRSPLAFTFGLENAEAWIAPLSEPRQPLRPARELLKEALAAEIREPGRYTSHLEELSFPQGFWHSEAHEDLAGIAQATFEELGVQLAPRFLEGLDLEVEVWMGPEDYETGPGSDSWARREQIRRICVAANAATSSERQLYAFREDLPGWAFDEPVWILLSPDERGRLLGLGILSPLEDDAEARAQR